MEADPSKSITRVYDEIANTYEQLINQPTDYIDVFLGYIPQHGRILDSGCGIGTDAGYMRQKGYAVTGIDLSPGMLNIARRNHPGIDFQLQDLRNPGFPANAFHGILSAFSLIHVPKKDVDQTLNNYHQLLKNKGILLLALQGGKSEEVFLDEPFKPGEKTFLDIFSYNEIGDHLARAGFHIKAFRKRASDGDKEFSFDKMFIIAGNDNQQPSG